MDPRDDWPGFKAAVVAAARLGGWGRSKAVQFDHKGFQVHVVGNTFELDAVEWVELVEAVRELYGMQPSQSLADLSARALAQRRCR